MYISLSVSVFISSSVCYSCMPSSIFHFSVLSVLIVIAPFAFNPHCHHFILSSLPFVFILCRQSLAFVFIPICLHSPLSSFYFVIILYCFHSLFIPFCQCHNVTSLPFVLHTVTILHFDLSFPRRISVSVTWLVISLLLPCTCIVFLLNVYITSLSNS